MPENQQNTTIGNTQTTNFNNIQFTSPLHIPMEDLLHNTPNQPNNQEWNTEQFVAALEAIKIKYGGKEKKNPPDPNIPFEKLIAYSSIHPAQGSKYKEFENKQNTTIPVVETKTLFGIEIEVENITEQIGPLEYYWTMKDDGSLRNNGKEFVSLPLRLSQVEIALKHLASKITLTNNPDFSNRTSVHVHMNARNMSQDNLYCFVMLYAIFERHFFKFAGTKRENSIFCVPIYKTNYLRRLDGFIYDLKANWSKYCGLNLAPMFSNTQTASYGTVEFRHLYGTFDPKIIVPWMNSIAMLKAAALKWTKQSLLVELKRMNTVSSYSQMYREIFGDFVNESMTKEDFEFCISQVKKEIFRNEYVEKIKKYNDCEYMNLLSILGV